MNQKENAKKIATIKTIWQKKDLSCYEKNITVYLNNEKTFEFLLPSQYVEIFKKTIFPSFPQLGYIAPEGKVIFYMFSSFDEILTIIQNFFEEALKDNLFSSRSIQENLYFLNYKEKEITKVLNRPLSKKLIVVGLTASGKKTFLSALKIKNAKEYKPRIETIINSNPLIIHGTMQTAKNIISVENKEERKRSSAREVLQLKLSECFFVYCDKKEEKYIIHCYEFKDEKK